eukprot:1672200-Prorocentrum_lima.AAC.1
MGAWLRSVILTGTTRRKFFHGKTTLTHATHESNHPAQQRDAEAACCIAVTQNLSPSTSHTRHHGPAQQCDAELSHLLAIS